MRRRGRVGSAGPVSPVSHEYHPPADPGKPIPGWAPARAEGIGGVVLARRVTSDPFVVGAPGDRVRIHGKVTDEGVECPAVRGPFGTLYTLAAPDFDHAPGTELMIEGTIAGTSICMQGTTIQVQSVRAH